MPDGSGPSVQVALDADTDKVLAEILERLRRLG
jgi:pyrimidine-specific ribonucleoside hydrolase